MAQLTQCLPHNPEDLSSISRTYIKIMTWSFMLVLPALGR